VPPYPLGTQVAVTTGPWDGCTGVVAHVHGDDLTRPVIRLLATADGERIARELDLRRNDTQIRGIVKVPAEAPCDLAVLRRPGRHVAETAANQLLALRVV
jgi:hypothetical protein